MFYNMLRSSVTNCMFAESEIPAIRRLRHWPWRNYATKRPLDIFAVDRIVSGNLFRKDLYCIILIRDVRSMVTSVHSEVPEDYFIGYDHQYFVQGQHHSFSNPGILQIHAAIEATQQRQDIHVITIKYEDLVERPDSIQEELAKPLGFRYAGRFADFHQTEPPPQLVTALNGLRAPDGSARNNWRLPQHRERIRTQFSSSPQMLDILCRYGYEEDHSWFNAYFERPEGSTPC